MMDLRATAPRDVIAVSDPCEKLVDYANLSSLSRNERAGLREDANEADLSKDGRFATPITV